MCFCHQEARLTLNGKESPNPWIKRNHLNILNKSSGSMLREPGFHCSQQVLLSLNEDLAGSFFFLINILMSMLRILSFSIQANRSPKGKSGRLWLMADIASHIFDYITYEVLITYISPSISTRGHRFKNKQTNRMLLTSYLLSAVVSSFYLLFH